MKLDEALNILADSHTRDNSLTGFTVFPLADLQWRHRSEYVEAWEAVRMHLHRNVNPSPTPTDR